MVKNLVLFASLCGCGVSAEEAISVDESALERSGDGTAMLWMVHDGRVCTSSPSGCGYYVGRLNRYTTRCPDGVHRLYCHVNVLDTSRLDESDERLFAWPAWLDRPVGLLVRGHLDRTELATRVVAEELWVAGGETGVARGTAVYVEQTGIRCIQEPCEDKAERVLNLGAATRIAELDFGAGRFTPDEEQLGIASLLPELGGLIVIGYRYIVARNGIVARGRTVSQFYTRWPPLPGAPMSTFACEALDGIVRADIGDGQVTCEPDETSLGSVATGIEGGVCCRPSAPDPRP